MNWLSPAAIAILPVVGVAIGASAYSYQPPPPQPPTIRPHDSSLIVAGTVRMRDGSPVAGAILRTTNVELSEPPIVSQTEEQGRFRFSSVFGEGCRLHVSSADAMYQAVFSVASATARTRFSAPLHLTLLPAITTIVTVLAEGRPVTGALVVAVGTDFQFQVEAVTGHDGKARLRLPARVGIRNLFAWHPALGVIATQGTRDDRPEATTQLTLLPPAPHKVRVFDEKGQPIAGIALGVSVKSEGFDWIATKDVEPAHVRTDAEGCAIIPWAPRENLQYVEVEIPGSDLKIDVTDLTQIAAGLTTIHARRIQPVQGRLIMPKGVSAEGILITGLGFRQPNGHIPAARAHKDGTFTLGVASNHAYVIGVTDLQWASDPWSGVILGDDNRKSTEIAINVYPATPLTVRVTRGPGRDPVANARVDVSSQGRVTWTGGDGKKRTGTAGARTWLVTDRNGIFQTGVGKGKQQLGMISGTWFDNRIIDVTSEKPVDVEFHRDWPGDQRVTGRLMLDGAPCPASPSMSAYAWEPGLKDLPDVFQPTIRADGTFDVVFDCQSISLLFLDRDQQRSGFVERFRGDAQVDIHLDETGTYTGTLVNDAGNPIANRTLQFLPKTLLSTVVLSAQTDEVGRFRLTGVPAKVGLHFGIRRVPGDPFYLVETLPDFKPGEVRSGQRLTLRRAAP